MTSTSLPVRLPSRRVGLLAALAVQLLASGCWPGSSDNAAKDSKMQPVAAANTPATASAPAAVVAPKSGGAVGAKGNGVEVREGDIKMAEDDIGQQIGQMPP